MKLSKAIGIGSATVKAKPGTQYDLKENSGCAIGMAIVGAGSRWIPGKPGEPHVGRSGHLDWWPWTEDLAQRPCHCWFFPDAGARILAHVRYYGTFRPDTRVHGKKWLLPRQMPVKDLITHLFDQHVFGKGDWTLEQLREWVASVEPQQDDFTGPRPVEKVAEKVKAPELDAVLVYSRRLRAKRKLIQDLRCLRDNAYWEACMARFSTQQPEATDRTAINPPRRNIIH